MSRQMKLFKKNYNKALKYYNLALSDNPENIYYLEGKARAFLRWDT